MEFLSFQFPLIKSLSLIPSLINFVSTQRRRSKVNVREQIDKKWLKDQGDRLCKARQETHQIKWGNQSKGKQIIWFTETMSGKQVSSRAKIQRSRLSSRLVDLLPRKRINPGDRPAKKPLKDTWDQWIHSLSSRLVSLSRLFVSTPRRLLFRVSISSSPFVCLTQLNCYLKTLTRTTIPVHSVNVFHSRMFASPHVCLPLHLQRNWDAKRISHFWWKESKEKIEEALEIKCTK